MTVQQTFATLGRSTVPLIAAAIIADLHVDPALVGGIVIRAGDLVIDGSVQGKLHALATHLNR